MQSLKPSKQEQVNRGKRETGLYERRTLNSNEIGSKILRMSYYSKDLNATATHPKTHRLLKKIKGVSTVHQENSKSAQIPRK